MRDSSLSTFLSTSPLSITIGIACAFVGGCYMMATRKDRAIEEGGTDNASTFLTYTPFEPPHNLSTDWQVLRAMWFAKITGEDLQTRLDCFYEKQADLYDSYRFRMLHGRPKMLRGVTRHAEPKKDGIVWVDLACGTGANTENFRESLKDGNIRKVYLVDLCRPLCQVAKRERGEKYGQDKVQVVHGDVTNENLEGLPPAGSVDLVTISYSLVMIPDWEKCIANAKRLLRPGGIIGVADFTVAPDQYGLSKKFWVDTFEKDHVFLKAEHLPTIQREFKELESSYGYGPLPYTPFFLKPAYYYFVGQKQ